MNKSYAELQKIMNCGSGTNEYHRLTMIRNFLVTDGVKLFAEAASAYWLSDVVMSYLPKIAKINDYFFVVIMKVNDDNRGTFRICHEINGKKKTTVRQKIPFTNLPVGDYKFFLFKRDGVFLMMFPKEY
jgi:hypothetical protein